MKLNRLTAFEVRNAGEGKHADGGGLYLIVGAKGSRSWIFRYRRRGGTGESEIGLGSAEVVTLKDAREKAGQARVALADGLDPKELKNREAPKVAPAFRVVAKDYIAAMTPSWRNAKHSGQWPSSLEAYVYPKIGDRPVDTITTEDVLAVLTPIWTTKVETANRVRGRIEAVLDAASARGLRSGENPARWRGGLARVLAPPGKIATVQHHAAAAADDMPAIMATLAATKGVTPLALRFLILTASRSGEVLGATWGEVDLAEKVWTVPAERMKAGRVHRVPLSAPALAVLDAAKALRLSDDPAAPIFPARSGEGFMAHTALATTLGRKVPGPTPHGFRSTFRDWAAERGEDWATAEKSLAHSVGSSVVQAYLRSDLLEQRRGLMDRWGTFCCGT